MEGNYPKRPVIQKLGTIDCDIVETTPIVFGGELYRFEYVRDDRGGHINHKNKTHRSYFHLVNVRNNTEHAAFGFDHHLGCAYTDGGIMYAVGCRGSWGSDTLDFYRSNDLDNWERYSSLHLPDWAIFNTGICRIGDTYTLLLEISAPAEECGPHPFTFRFAQSTDMVNWTLTPAECAFQRDRYAGAPAIYSLENDPHYYVFYLEEYPGPCYATCVARSTDLVNWEYSPINPVLMYDDFEDKKIASKFITPEERARIAAARDINNSDLEMCEFLGRVIIYYSWGDQLGTEFLAEACFEGGMREFITAFFETEDN